MSDQFYRRAAWRKFRAEFLKRHPMCAVTGCGRPATHVDHKIRRPIGPDFPPDSGLDGLCAEHHGRKTRLHDQPRKLGPYEHRLIGCDQDGNPLDKSSHWRT
jgi:hypothetical protein